MPNYMKPTISSNARKENQQVPIHSRPATSSSTDMKKRSSNTRDSHRSGGLNPAKATCSSTLKDSKFPKALDLVAGGTEAQGKSATKVCPYAYCSLNGHHRELLPPLKHFIVSARRKSLETRKKSMELEGDPSSSFRVRGVGKDEKKEDTGQTALVGLERSVTPNEIYSSMQNDDTETPEDMLRYEEEDDADQNSEPSDEDMYEKKFLDYVECDLRLEDAREENGLGGLLPNDCEELHVEDVLGKISREVEAEIELGWDEEVESFLPEHSDKEEEAPEDDDVVATSSPSGAFSLDPTADDAYVTDEANAELPRGANDEVAERTDAMGLHDGSGGGADDADSSEGEDVCLSNASTSKGDYDLHRNWGVVGSVFESSREAVSEELEEDTETENTLDGPEVQVIVVYQRSIEEGDGTSSSSVALHSQHSDSCDNFTELEMQDFKCNAEVEDARENYKGSEQQEMVDIDDEMKARMRIIRKKTTEEQEETKEFNPRGPRFLAVEPDPEAEKVDLRHQMMDEKKNAEEWMIDYALRQALMKLAPAPKRKVSLLVQAFETVTPLHDWEKSLQHATSGFGHARIIQACN
ncbi:uncharacterized protein M6B38_255710 [Iris pallida]|uniref:Calmodulin-binding domain-containing protein n=1 Tax=Iris pallida TaxID=29817 RepID=A0AAX6IHD0_IRIPA|nr:uncharacterized protein M6B38_255710 [Iris pallida]